MDFIAATEVTASYPKDPDDIKVATPDSEHNLGDTHNRFQKAISVWRGK